MKNAVVLCEFSLFMPIILVFIVISLVLPMRFIECITSRYENFWCFRVFYVILMKKMAKNGKI